MPRLPTLDGTQDGCSLEVLDWNGFRPGERFPNSRLKILNHLACSSSKFLNAFHGSAEKYSFEQFCEPAFLNNHCRKAFILLNLS